MDEPALDFDRLPARRWGLIFTLLSMDLAQPFSGALGLAAFPLARFRNDLRAVILDYRAHVLATRTPEPIAARAFARLDADDGWRLFEWCTGTFMYVMADQKVWYRWYLSLSRVVYDAPAASRLIDLLSGETLNTVRAAMDTGSVEATIAGAKRSPLSQWDVEMYARHGFNDEIGPDPFDIILSTVKIARTQALMTSLVESLDPESLRVLHVDSARYLAALGLDPVTSFVPPQGLVRVPKR